MQLQMRQARPDDLDTIVRWRGEAAGWIAERGGDQWSSAGLDDRAFRDRVAESIAAGETWIATDDDIGPVGTIAIDSQSDPGLWSRGELATAVIIHRMIVPRHAAGLGVGEQLIAQAERVAEQRGRAFIRLDAWTTNGDLHSYYQRAGFRHVRTVAGHSTPSAALFERRVWSVAPPEFSPIGGRCDP